VVQQGMNDSYARRYHWLSDRLESFVEEPHNDICFQRQEQTVLDLTASESRENRKVTLDIVRDGPSHLGIRKAQRSLLDFGDIKPAPIPELSMPKRHELIALLDIGEAGRKALELAYEIQPSSYEELIALKGLTKKNKGFGSDIRTCIWCKPKLERPSQVQPCPWWKGRNAIPSRQNDL